MTTEDDIAFLEDFRDRIMRFLVAGAAPSQDPVWGTKGIFQMEEGMKDPAFRALRQDIDRMKGRAATIVEGLGIACIFQHHPPAAAGGPIQKHPLFDLITDNRSQHNIDGALFTGRIDEAIGRLQHAAAERAAQAVTAAMPVLPVRDLDAAAAFYAETLGFAPGARGAGFAIVERGAAKILLRAGARPSRGADTSWDAFLLTPDPDALAAAVAGAAATMETAAGMRGFTVADPDGNRLFFGRPA
ncbi:MAG: VOC family protein [Alphaproteobacteria bacterium]